MQNLTKKKNEQSTVLGGLSTTLARFTVVKRNQKRETFALDKITAMLDRASRGFETIIDRERVLSEFSKNIYTGITTRELEKALLLSVTPFIERDPAYSKVAARLLLITLYKEIFGCSTTEPSCLALYTKQFGTYLTRGIEAKTFDPRLISDFDTAKLAAELKPERDYLFDYMGIQTIYEKYLMQINDIRIEAPQYFWMRIAMGVALAEKPELRTEKAIEFYHLVSQFKFVPGTPTLLHAGTTRSQLSSCYLTTVTDDLHHIFKCLGDNAQLSKYSGGVANDWTSIRATGSKIKSIDVGSQGVVPFLKLVNDVTAVINRSGKRRGATCVYLETWHLDIEDFLDMRKNTGDERRRAHDINTANWIPDLFMKRVEANGTWTLLCPDDAPDLHELYGKAFETRYAFYEQRARDGLIKRARVINAKDLWKKMLMRLFETGHPWMTFKDAFNVRSPQDHAGVIRSTNLCTEIGLNTSKEETAVCNLGSVNIARHMNGKQIDEHELEKTISTAMRMLDNVIDVNFYPTKEAETANMRHRPVGLGIMGLQDGLSIAEIPFDDDRARVFCDNLMESVSYYAIKNSALLAQERGAYKSFKGSKWDRNIFPIDTLDLLEQERGSAITVDRDSKKDWTPVRDLVQKHGMRNSNTMAIAPTATISNISGCMPCIEPIYKNLYVKANQQGEFTIINKYLVEDLKSRGLWTETIREKLKFCDGSVQTIEEIPADVRAKYKTAFEIDPQSLVKLTAARSKWIDQSQSYNVFLQGTSGKQLHEIYFAGWKAGIKSFYYLRSLGASQIEKSTLDAKQYGFTQKRQEIQACAITDPECESCQ